MYPRRLSILLFSLIFLLSCGYRFGSYLVTGGTGLVLSQIDNETSYPLEGELRIALEEGLNSKGITLSQKGPQLHVTIKEYSKEPSMFDDNNVPLEYKVFISVTYAFSGDEQQIKKGEIKEYGTYNPEESNEEAAVEEILLKISEKISENLTDNW